jgi:hypothetical protein
MNASLLGLFSLAVLFASEAAPAIALAQAQSFDGAYKGSLECKQLPNGELVFRSPIAMTVRSDR